MRGITADLMLFRASSVECLPLDEEHVFETAHLNVSPALQMALNTRAVFIQRLCLERWVRLKAAARGRVDDVLNRATESPTNL